MLQDNPDMTQREIAEKLGISTSGLNYCLKALIDKGWVKVQTSAKVKTSLAISMCSRLRVLPRRRCLLAAF